MVSARLPGGESLALTSPNAPDNASPLRDAQLLARAQLAPFFAIANVIAALLMAASLIATLSSPTLLGWVGTVALVNFVAMHLSRNQAITHVGRSGRQVPHAFMVGDVLIRAMVWLSLPLYYFPSLDPASQLVTASLISGLGIAALGLVVVPACVTAWMASFTIGLCYVLFTANTAMPFLNKLQTLFTLGVAVVGVFSVARWAFRQLETNADMGSASESASLLLQEYEQRGVGWLWQVDAENRVTYISSRMTALLGRPASALVGHSMPALLGGSAELGKILIERQPFNNLEMELKTARGPRWISIAGDP
ncbi:MAG: PAS domain-containing protein, partial [Sphingomicrobium sp.]